MPLFVIALIEQNFDSPRTHCEVLFNGFLSSLRKSRIKTLRDAMLANWAQFHNMFYPCFVGFFVFSDRVNKVKISYTLLFYFFEEILLACTHIVDILLID